MRWFQVNGGRAEDMTELRRREVERRCWGIRVGCASVPVVDCEEPDEKCGVMDGGVLRSLDWFCV